MIIDFCSEDKVPFFHICGDNIDKTIKQRYMRVGKSASNEIHYFHSYAVSDRIDFSDLSETVIPTTMQDPRQIALSLLPTPEDDQAIRNNMCILMSRIIFENMEFAKVTFDGVVNWHIEHEFYKEMSGKSSVVSTCECIVTMSMMHNIYNIGSSWDYTSK